MAAAIHTAIPTAWRRPLVVVSAVGLMLILMSLFARRYDGSVLPLRGYGDPADNEKEAPPILPPPLTEEDEDIITNSKYYDFAQKEGFATHHFQNANISAALVLPKTREETMTITWLNAIDQELWKPHIYSVNNEPGYDLYPPMNKGRESMVYLSYVIDHYDKLPDVSLFVHADPTGWHNDIITSGLPGMIPRLRLTHLMNNGYTNIRCTHLAGCYPSDDMIKPFATEEELEGIFNWDYRRIFKKHYMQIMGVKDESKVPREVANICCAQFAVSRERIQKRRKSEYERMRQWILDAEIGDHHIGWLFEKLWHMIFGENAVHCPEFGQCTCDLYGWCGPLADGEYRTPKYPGREGSGRTVPDASEVQVDPSMGER